ncbi:MAG: 50S ribosomal protein L23 [Armatimonadetes bacterium]|nr:50S ribosomal protein L23 [Armatimonadota bacterium]
MSRDPHSIILKPRLTEKSVLLAEEGKYVFLVSPEANRIEIAQAIELIYNRGKKKKDRIKVFKVNVINTKGKTRRTAGRVRGRKPNRKKAIVTLEYDQRLEGFGV